MSNSDISNGDISILGQAKPVSFILVRDREKAKAFYGGALGLTMLSEDAFAATYDLGGGATMRLSTVADYHAHQHPVIGWHVGDLSAAVAAMKAKGVSFNIYKGFGQDADGVWTAPDGSMKIAWFNDPEGNVLSVSSA